MRYKATKFQKFLILIMLIIPVIIIGKLFYNQSTLSSDEDLQTQLIEKISKAEKIPSENIKIEEIDSFSEGKLKYVMAYYKINNGLQKIKTFKYEQAVFGRAVVGKEVK